MAPRKIIHDCDPGQDDAMALLLELASPEAFELLAVTTVAGNVSLERTTENARRIVELAGHSDLPVHPGCPRPLKRPLIDARHVHGESGLDGSGLPPAWLHPEEGHAVAYLIETLAEPELPITLLATGPLTNVASALVAAPRIAAGIAEIVLMGGALGRGNVTPSAEFNFHVDPDAAAIVLAAGLKLTMLGLDVTRQARATAARIAALEALANPVTASVAGMLRHGLARARAQGEPGPPVHDVLVPAYLLVPHLFAARPAHIRVIAWGETDLGRSVELAGEAPNATVVEAVDADRLFALLLERYARYPLRISG
ncbi:MAG TPA: nucleoside hydrolase [Alphaproteobacteria bacterium]|nr:nucleoside hydrolase [Alphaproteobacteria bacterium]